MAEITSALLRRVFSTHLTPCSASHWEAPHEIHIGEREDAPPAIFLCDVQSNDRSKLSARNRDAARLLQSGLLRRSLRMRGRASRTSVESIVSSPPVMLSRWARPMARSPRSRSKIAKLLDRVTAL